MPKIPIFQNSRRRICHARVLAGVGLCKFFMEGSIWAALEFSEAGAKAVP